MNDTKKITVDDVIGWEIESLADAIGNCLALNDDFLERYCGAKIAEQLRRIPESEREYILQSHIGQGYSVHTIPTTSDCEIFLNVQEIEFPFEGAPEDTFENPGDFYIDGNLAYVTLYGVYFPVDVQALAAEIDEHLSGAVVDDVRDDFLRGVFDGMIFTGQFYPCPDDFDRSESIDKHFSVDDIPREIVREIESEADDFLADSAFMIVRNPYRAGVDFHLTRNRHGAGFWDGDWPDDSGRILTERAHFYGTAELMAGPDGIFLTR